MLDSVLADLRYKALILRMNLSSRHYVNGHPGLEQALHRDNCHGVPPYQRRLLH
ncbi:MAG TPA: hypothetical protein VGF89_09905 [Steroidobacteraceae bacterium]|jgi:hypothetical protein